MQILNLEIGEFFARQMRILWAGDTQFAVGAIHAERAVTEVGLDAVIFAAAEAIGEVL